MSRSMITINYPSRSFILRQLIHRWMQLLQFYGRYLTSPPHESHIWRKRDDWDVICILDACRLKQLESVLDREVPSVSSGVSMSRPWYDLTFNSDSTPDLSNVGLITGNPWASILDFDRFAYAHFEEVSMTEYGIETVNPTSISERAVDVWRNRDELGVEKLIVHYMQPHVPLRSRPEWFQKYLGKDNWGGSVMRKMATGEIDRDEFSEAYEDNTYWVFEDGVDILTNNCSGDIVVTADHSTGFGEWGVYGHPPYIPFGFIQKVPWLSIESRDTHSIDGTIDESSQEVDIEQQLAALGYMNE